MSNLDEVRINILAKFKQALDLDGQQTVMPFVRLALLDQQAVFEAILLQRQAAQGEQVDLWQVRKLRLELEEAINERNAADRECANLEEDLDAARTAHASVCEERDSLQVQLLAMDADNARLTQEVQRLRSWTVDADARAIAAQRNGDGKSTPAATLVQAVAPAAFVVASEEAEDYRDGLNNGRWKWTQVPKRIRLELVRSVIAATPNHTQSEFDAVRPAWMATATAHCAAFGSSWRDLADLTHEIEVPA